MTLHLALAAAATVISAAFALSLLERWLARRRRHEAAWTVALTLFCLASGALWWGAAAGWTNVGFRFFYLFGAIANVPFLALGTVYLLAGTRIGDRTAVGVVVFTSFAAGVMAVAPAAPIPDPSVLPQGKELYGPLPRILAAGGSGVAATVVIVGAVWSAIRLLRGRRRPGTVDAGTPPTVTAPASPAGISPGRLAAANLLIALGTLITGASGAMNGILNEMDAFALLLALGITVIFCGFLLTMSAPAKAAQLRPLHWVEAEPEPLAPAPDAQADAG